MKKMKSMRAAVTMTIATLLTTCLIGGSLGRYTTAASSADNARVAYWGFSSANSISLEDLFSDEYENVKSKDGTDVIAPGTSGQSAFAFIFERNGSITAPEVAYTFTVSVDASCDDAIKNNSNIRFKLDNGAYGTWDQLIASIRALSGNSSGTKVYAAGELPAAFSNASAAHTISWQWLFTDTADPAVQDAKDTAMGNAASPIECALAITVSAVQVD